MLLNNEWVNNDIKEEIKVSGNKWKWIHNNPKHMGHSEGSPEREVHSNKSLPPSPQKRKKKKKKHFK